MKRLLPALALAALVAPAGVQAAQPGLWLRTSSLSEPSSYLQGIASNPKTGDVFFSGPFVGIHRTRGGHEVASNNNAIPADVTQREQYNHIGDIAFDPAEGGRLLLPMESYQPLQPDHNPSKTGSIGVMDARTLQWKYYVKLDPAEIEKAQWIATDPAQGLFWTITGSDLLAYRLSDLNPADAAPNAAPIHSVRRLAGVAPGGAGGAVVLKGRIYLSTQTGDVDRIVSIDERTGASRVEFEQPGTAEPEGLDAGPYYGGLLHWEMVPGGALGNTVLVNLLPKGAHLRLTLAHRRVKARHRTALRTVVRVLAGGFAIALKDVQVRLGTKRARTNARGEAKLVVELTRGLYRAQAFFKGLRTGSARVRAT